MTSRACKREREKEGGVEKKIEEGNRPDLPQDKPPIGGREKGVERVEEGNRRDLPQ